tara:strand:+ start:214 stop:447 length:234 start_codon:yes stop_codon:yes gene_type:complete
MLLKKLPIKDPLMKLDPIIKPTGKLTELSINKLTLLFLELFCIPIINNKKKQEFNITEKIIFLNENNIYRYFKLLRF